MDIRAVALALPAGAASFVAAARGAAAWEGAGARSFAVLLATGLAGLAALAVAAARRPAVRLPPLGVELLLCGTATALGDAALVFDGEGRLAWANDVALALSPEVTDALRGRRSHLLGAELAAVRRGLARGSAARHVRLETPGGPRMATAAAVRVPGAGPADVVLLRLAPTTDGPGVACEVGDGDIVVEPPPLPAPGLRAHATTCASPAPETVLAAALGAPLARAASALALLRMGSPPAPIDASRHLDTIEEALHDAEGILAAVASPIAPAVRRATDVDALLRETLGAVRGHAIRIAHERRAAEVMADAAQLRQALHHLLLLAVARMPFGGALSVRTRVGGGRVVIEIADTGASVGREPGVDLPLARRLVAAQGGLLELSRSPGRGSRTRLSLPAAPPARAAGA